MLKKFNFRHLFPDIPMRQGTFINKPNSFSDGHYKTGQEIAEAIKPQAVSCTSITTSKFCSACFDFCLQLYSSEQFNNHWKLVFGDLNYLDLIFMLSLLLSLYKLLHAGPCSSLPSIAHYSMPYPRKHTYIYTFFDVVTIVSPHHNFYRNQ